MSASGVRMQIACTEYFFLSLFEPISLRVPKYKMSEFP